MTELQNGSQTHPCKNTGIYYRTNGRGDDFILSAPIYSWVRIVETLTWLLDLIKLSNNNLVKDGYIFPALYCFRHYLELIMKDSIHYFKINRGNISSNELGYDDNEHCLFNLWNSLRNFIDDESPQIRRVCNLIKELDNIDKGSTFFRYAFNHENGEIKEYDFPATMIDISELKKRMMQLYCFFEGINFMSRKS